MGWGGAPLVICGEETSSGKATPDCIGITAHSCRCCTVAVAQSRHARQVGQPRTVPGSQVFSASLRCHKAVGEWARNQVILAKPASSLNGPARQASEPVRTGLNSGLTVLTCWDRVGDVALPGCPACAAEIWKLFFVI